MKPTENTLEDEYKKGEFNGISTVMNFPGSEILDAEEILGIFEKQRELDAKAEDAAQTEEKTNGDGT